MWITVNGETYPCATTTAYLDDTEGACGCGNGSGPFPWQISGAILTSAASDFMFYSELYGGTDNGSTWCGPGCGQCFEVTPTGGYVPGQGDAPSNTNPIVMMITNMCPAIYNQQWCTSPNQYGYMAHFDMGNGATFPALIAAGWNNPEVYFKPITCPPLQAEAYNQCECSK
jgi:endoglucanase